MTVIAVWLLLGKTHVDPPVNAMTYRSSRPWPLLLALAFAPVALHAAACKPKSTPVSM